MDNNSVSWAFRLADYASDTLKKFGGTARDVFGGVDRDVDRLQRDMRDLGKPVVLQVDSSALRNAQSQIESVHSRMGFLATSGAMFVGNLAAQGVNRAVNFAEQQIQDVFKSGKSAGVIRAGFETLAGKEAGGALFQDLTKYIGDSIFGPELYGQAEFLKNFGIPTPEILPDLKMFGDITGGNTERMGFIERAYGQVFAKGKLMAQEVNQMMEQGFNPLTEISRTTGKSMAELSKQMEAGHISAKMVRDAFVSATSAGGMFYGRLDAIAKTPYGIEQAQMGNIEMAKMGLGEGLMGSYGALLRETQPLVDELPATLKELQPQIESIVMGLADMVKWTRTNTETLGKWVGLVKLGVEAWVAWKIGTVAMTAANWVWVSSIGAQTTQTAAATVALTEENAAILAQTEELAVLRNAWAMMGAEQKAFMATAATNSTILNAGTSAVGVTRMRQWNAGATSLAGGLAAGAASAAVPVMIAYFGGEAMLQLLGKNPLTGEDMHLVGKGSVMTESGRVGLGAAVLQALGIMPTVEDEIKRKQDFRDLVAGLNAPGFQRGLTGAKVIDFGGGVKVDLGGNSPTGGNAGANEVSEAILGGGTRPIYINFKNWVENFNQNVDSKAEGQHMTVQDLKIMFSELLASLPR